MPWQKLLHVGDIWLTLAMAAAITTWLLMAGASRMAFWWSLLFGLGIALVGANKVAFMAWGLALPGLDFKAASGHATGVTAVFPTFLFLLLQQRGRRARAAGVAAGLALGALMGVLLVAEDEHSVAEAIAGWVMGATISLGAIGMAGALPPSRPRNALVGSALVFLSAAYLAHKFPFVYLMMRTAMFISGNASPFPWNTGS